MKLQVSGIFQILNIKRNAKCTDGREWCQGSLLNFFEADAKEYIYFSAFGHNATFIMDHHTGSNSRRAYITGLLETEIVVEKVKVNIKGEPVIIKRNKTVYKMVIDSVRFLDKNRHADEINTIDEADYANCDEIDITEGAISNSTSYEEADETPKANTNDTPIVKSRNSDIQFDEIPDEDEVMNNTSSVLTGGRGINKKNRNKR